MNKEHAHVIGAGPAGLVAAINLAKSGYPVTVYDMNKDVGKRFDGDYQVIENWSTEEDARQFLQAVGVETNFRFEPYADGDFFNPSEERYKFNISRPLFYLVERGTSEWSLDQGLKRQALQAGVEFDWGQRMTHAPDGKVIIATGPKATDAVARGMVFKTTHENYFAAFIDDEIAPQGYAYLLVNNGRATFGTCIFEKFSESFTYFDAAFERMKKLVNIDVIDSKRFGGYVNFFLDRPLMKDHRIYYVGENAGFQDALFGFGMRYAMHSGYLAAQSIIEHRSYPDLCKEHIIPTLQAQYNPSWYKRTVLPVAKRAFRNRLEDKQCMHEDCSCVWCKHGEHAYAEVEC